uniref:Uncharacterized protein n=1 Tax=Rodentolepis nana TaxID=102285 RepID=A0A0R3TBW7_RODNA
MTIRKKIYNLKIFTTISRLPSDRTTFFPLSLPVSSEAVIVPSRVQSWCWSSHRLAGYDNFLSFCNNKFT